jgi:hypothetical protein
MVLSLCGVCHLKWGGKEIGSKIKQEATSRLNT